VIAPFRPDLFSVKGPGWVPVSDDVTKTIRSVLSSTGDPTLAPTGTPEQAKGLEINSNNLRVMTPTGPIAVKRWSAAADPVATVRTLELMEWLDTQGVAVPRPLRLNDRLVVDHDGHRWSAFRFMEGKWFTGEAGEARSAARVSGALAATLARTPEKLRPAEGPRHLTAMDDELLSRADAERGSWAALLGEQLAATLDNAWPEITGRWRSLRDHPPEAGAERVSHFDLHPHNLLMQRGEVSAVLDFESCRTMPLGYAMAFAGLKQGRQTVVAAGNLTGARDVGAAFLANFRAACPEAESLTRVADLATAEVLRRITIILRLNLEQRISTWNAVLPVQIAHLQEARLLFN
jgi:Ser/Thr protein kinase RdoA (MazF antagonist)